MNFDPQRAWLKGPDMFHRFRVSDEGLPVADAGLKPETELLVFQRGGQRRALLRRQMLYHHVAEGEVAGQPFLVSF